MSRDYPLAFPVAPAPMTTATMVTRQSLMGSGLSVSRDPTARRATAGKNALTPIKRVLNCERCIASASALDLRVLSGRLWLLLVQKRSSQFRSS